MSLRDLDLTSADFRRKDAAKKTMSEEMGKLQTYKDIQKRQKEEEIKRDMEMLMNYNPWGRPGGGAPMNGENRFKFSSSNNIQTLESEVEMDDELGSALPGFGRPGAGAPIRSESGRLLTQISGDPEIRFQDNNVVRRAIENGIRYKNIDKNAYKEELDKLVKEKRERKQKEGNMDPESDSMSFFGRKPRRTSSMPKLNSASLNKMESYDPWGKGFGNPYRDDSGNVFPRNPRLVLPEISSPLQEEGSTIPLWRLRNGGGGAPKRSESGTVMTRLPHKLGYHQVPAVDPNDVYDPWGKPGGGAPMENGLSGQGFLEKMGWSTSGIPNRRKRFSSLNGISNQTQHEQLDPGMGDSIVSIMKQKEVGRPRRDPNTGELLPQLKSTSDVTAQRMDIRRARSHESLEYMNSLVQQAEERRRRIVEKKKQEELENQRHFEAYSDMWGRPGGGAPRDSNLRMKLENSLYMPLPGEVEVN